MNDCIIYGAKKLKSDHLLKHQIFSSQSPIRKRKHEELQKSIMDVINYLKTGSV